MSEQPDSRTQMDSVIATAASYWAGEAEVVREYFLQPRTTDRDLQWLRAQAYKEARPFRDLSLPLQEEFLRTGTLTRHPHGPEMLVRLSQEVQHFSLLAEVIFTLSGKAVSLHDHVDLPEDRKLQKLRAGYRTHGPLERAAVEFTEGGGGAMFHVLRQLDGGEFEREIARVFAITAADEQWHGPPEVMAIVRYARDSGDWERARVIVREISHQRLHMRNEMFGFPLRPARVHEIETGLIQPWSMSIPL